MKKFGQGFIVGILITLLLTASIALAVDNPIKLIINGQEIKPDVPPKLIDGRVMVPARFIAEPLGATVEWDEKNRAVIITSKNDEIKKDRQEWLTLREIVEIKKWSIAPDGRVFDVNNNYLFNYNDVEHKTIDGIIYLPSSILEKY